MDLNRIQNVNRQTLKKSQILDPAEAPSAESMLRAIFDNCFQFIALLDSEGRLIEINRCSLETAGVQRTQVVGIPFWDTFFWTQIISPQYREEFIESWPRVCAGNFVRFEVRGHLANGDFRTVDFSVMPVFGRNSELKYAVAEARDITSYKNLELELVEKNQALSRINAELQDFAILASHDLRQPLQTLSVNTTILARLLPADADPECREQVKNMKESVHRMNLLLESILDYARSTKQSRDKTEVDTADILRETLDCLASSIDRVDIKINWKSMPVVRGNRIQLLRIFQNLLSNAIKFRDEKRRSEVRVGAEDSGQVWTFAIADNGIGMNEETQKALFRRFGQSKPKKLHGGIGAGLSICKDLVEQHGGKIWVESKAGQGSTFYFSVPKTVSRSDQNLAQNPAQNFTPSAGTT
jgi:PAS domain S-box-containing protein